MPPTFVIIGASLAGGTAAATLRQDGFDGDIILIGEEPRPPYERPPLSKQYLRGEAPFEKALGRPLRCYEDNRIDARFGVAATRVDPGGQKVDLTVGGPVHYDKLLIATGVRNRRPPILGLELPNIFHLRSVDDADIIRNQIAPGRRAAVIGMGFIGCEVAASLRQKRMEVVCIDPSPTPLFRVLGEEVGRAISGIHHEHGVETVFNDVVIGFEGTGRVERVLTKSGRRIDCHLAVVGVGVEPVVDFATGSGLDINNGILVDEYCETNIPGIYAAGDVANHYHPVLGTRMRVEHWQNAMQQGAAAARTMLGTWQSYDPVHWFWSDQYETNLQYAGFHHTSERLVVRGDIEARDFTAFYLNQGRVDAVVALNRGKDVRRVMPLIKARVTVDPRQLGDDDVDLRGLVDDSLSGAHK